MSSKCSFKCNWVVGASWVGVGPFGHLFGYGVEFFSSDVGV